MNAEEVVHYLSELNRWPAGLSKNFKGKKIIQDWNNIQKIIIFEINQVFKTEINQVWLMI